MTPNTVICNCVHINKCLSEQIINARQCGKIQVKVLYYKYTSSFSCIEIALFTPGPSFDSASLTNHNRNWVLATLDKCGRLTETFQVPYIDKLYDLAKVQVNNFPFDNGQISLSLIDRPIIFTAWISEILFVFNYVLVILN